MPVGTNPCVDTHQFPHVHTHMYTLACTQSHVHSHMYTVACTHWHVHTGMYTLTCTHWHVHTHMYTLACTHWHVHTGTNTLTCTHTCTQSHVHTCMYTLACTHSSLFTHHTLIYLHVLRTFAHLIGTPQEQKERQGSQQMCCVYLCTSGHFRPFHNKWLHMLGLLTLPSMYVRR